MADGDEDATEVSTPGMAQATYYDTIGTKEWDRLADTPEGRIEFTRTTGSSRTYSQKKDAYCLPVGPRSVQYLTRRARA